MNQYVLDCVDKLHNFIHILIKATGRIWINANLVQIHWMLPCMLFPSKTLKIPSNAGICWNIYLRWVEALRFICGSGTRIFHLRMSGPQMGSGVSPTIRMPQWWSRRWPPWDAPHRQKVALCILSLRVHAIPLRVAPMPAVRYDLNGGLPTCIRFIIYQEYMVIVYCYVFCKPDMVSVSILVE